MTENTKTIVWHKGAVTRAQRERMNGHRAAVLWFTGLSGAGKSTLAHAVEAELTARSCRAFVLDGDNVRHGLCSNLGFSAEDRGENIRRAGEAAKLLMEAGLIVLTAFISPFRADREQVRNLFPHGDFIEVHCAAPLKVCEQRDVKGLYQRARTGEIPEFTGISSPYEAPINPELRVATGELSLEQSLTEVIAFLQQRSILRPIQS